MAGVSIRHPATVRKEPEQLACDVVAERLDAAAVRVRDEILAALPERTSLHAIWRGRLAGVEGSAAAARSAGPHAAPSVRRTANERLAHVERWLERWDDAKGF